MFLPSVFSNQPGQTVIGIPFNSSGTLFGAAQPYGLAIDASGDVFTGGNSSSQILEYGPVEEAQQSLRTGPSTTTPPPTSK